MGMRWLGLRVRIVIALLAVAVGACLLLAWSTSEWAMGEYHLRLEYQVLDSVRTDMEAVAATLERNPDATVEDFVFPEPSAAGTLHAAGLLIPVPPGATRADPALAHTYSDLPGVDVGSLDPECLQPYGDWTNQFIVGDAQTGAPVPSELAFWGKGCAVETYAIAFGAYRLDSPGAVRIWLLAQALPIPADADPLWELREVLGGYSVFILIGTLVLAAALAAMVAHPLTRAGAMAEAVAAGDLSVRLPVRGRDEVARMSTAVNTMADQLTGQIDELTQANEAQRRFVADVAHELRTPTSALLASAEALENPETRDEAAALVAPQLRRMAELTEDLLEISRMDAGQAAVVTDRIDLSDLLAEVVTDAGADGISVIGPADLVVSVDAARLRVIVRNLVANALQHGRPPVEVAVTPVDDGVRISVHDAGAGVPEELRERVFDRFVRGDEARHGTSSGLGLAIAAENTRLLGGTLRLDGDGRTFVLELPGAHESGWRRTE
jgi:signal transduction histidine kinase